MKLQLRNLLPILSVTCSLAHCSTSTAAEKVIWREGHGDLAVNYANGAWAWTVERESEVSQVIIRLDDSTRKEIPDDPAFSFLGTPGQPIWIIPAGQTAGIPFLGINAEATTTGTFVNDRFDLHLSSVSGPGDFMMWTTTGIGTATVLMNSQNGITAADKTAVPVGGHFHQNWGFTSPGTYRLGFTASGMLTGQTIPTNSDEAVYTFEVNVLRTSEVDIEVAYEAGALEFHVHDESADVEFNPAHVALQAGPATWRTVPAGAPFSFLGNPGASIYVLPQDETEGVLFVGLGAGEVSAGTFADDRVTVRLLNVEGPGSLAYYEIDSFGAPTILLNSADGITATDAVNVAAGSHAHRNWSFSAPGVYRVTLQASGTLTAGGDVTSEPATFLFEVLPPLFPAQGEIDFEVAFADGELELGLLDEIAGRELSLEEAVLRLQPASRQLVPNDPAFNFLGPAGAPVFVLPQDETEGLLFLGIAGDEIAAGLFANERVNLDLVSLTGPGNFALYAVDSFGKPTVFMNTADGVSPADTFPIAVGSHTHLNWGFSEPGEYRLGFKATGTLSQGNQPRTSETAILRVLVDEVGAQSSPTLTSSLINNGRQLQISWPGRADISYQLQSRTDLAAGQWTNLGAAIPGRSAVQSTALDLGSESLRVFRLVETQP